MGAIIGVIAFLSVPLISGWFLVSGLRRGVIRAKGGNYLRSVDPIQSWVVAGVYAVLLVVYVGLFGYMALSDYLHR